MRKMIASVSTALMLVVGAAGFSLAAEAGNQNTDATVTFDQGTLELKSAPAFAFGERSIVAGYTEYDSPTVSAPLQVSDARGNAEGWKVTAALSGFKNGEEETLDGSTIVLSNPDVNAVGARVASGPNATGNIILPSTGTIVPIETAIKGTGMGLWNTSWSGTNVKLTVPNGSASTGSAKATINWILEDTPA